MPIPKWVCAQCGKSYDTAEDAGSCEHSHTAVLRSSQLNDEYKVKQSKPSWGFHLNVNPDRKSKGYPNWANPAQRDKWSARGIIIWDMTVQQITRVQATRALQILNHLQSNGTEAGVVIGEPSWRFSLDQPNQPPQPVLSDQISLNTVQSQDLRTFLQARESLLKQMAEEDEKQWKRRLSAACEILIDYYLRKKTKEPLSN